MKKFILILVAVITLGCMPHISYHCDKKRAKTDYVNRNKMDIKTFSYDRITKKLDHDMTEEKVNETMCNADEKYYNLKLEGDHPGLYSNIYRFNYGEMHKKMFSDDKVYLIFEMYTVYFNREHEAEYINYYFFESRGEIYTATIDLSSKEIFVDEIGITSLLQQNNQKIDTKH